MGWKKITENPSTTKKINGEYKNIIISQTILPIAPSGPMPFPSPSISPNPKYKKGPRVIIKKEPGHGVGTMLVPETGARTETRPAGRTCKEEDCSQILSMYNKSKYCWQHRMPIPLTASFKITN